MWSEFEYSMFNKIFLQADEEEGTAAGETPVVKTAGAAPQSCQFISGLPHHEIHSVFAWLPAVEVKRSALPMLLIRCFSSSATVVPH